MGGRNAGGLMAGEISGGHGETAGMVASAGAVGGGTMASTPMAGMKGGQGNIDLGGKVMRAE